MIWKNENANNLYERACIRVLRLTGDSLMTAPSTESAAALQKHGTQSGCTTEQLACRRNAQNYRFELEVPQLIAHLLRTRWSSVKPSKSFVQLRTKCDQCGLRTLCRFCTRAENIQALHTLCRLGVLAVRCIHILSRPCLT